MTAKTDQTRGMRVTRLARGSAGVGAVAIAVAMLCLAGAAGATTFTTNVQSDTSWRVTNVAPGTGWNTNAGYNDSGWAAAQVDYTGVSLGSHTIDEIWDNSDPNAGSAVIYLRKTFTLAGPASAAIMDVVIDDDVLLWVNGYQVINDTNCTAQDFLGNDVAAHLVQGTNLIAVQAHNCQGPGGFGLYMDVTSRPAQVPLLGRTGLLALGLAIALAGALVVRKLAA